MGGHDGLSGIPTKNLLGFQEKQTKCQNGNDNKKEREKVNETKISRSRSGRSKGE